MKLNSKNKKILEAVLKDPVSPSIPWREVERLLRALGGEVTEGAGSRVRVKLKKALAVFHRPHPEKVTDKGAIKSVRKLLDNSGTLKDLEEKRCLNTKDF